MSNTLAYYDSNAVAFVETTQKVDMGLAQQRFLELLPEGAYILDFGCGSGRDTKYFLERGYRVDAMDGSGELCRLASAYTGVEVKKMLFQELEAIDVYHGIWACSSILHLPKKELDLVIGKMSAALKDGGLIYTSFKYGDFEGMRNGRYFTDFREASFAGFLGDQRGLRIEASWISEDVRPGRGEEKWLNLLLRKWDTGDVSFCPTF